MSEQVRAYFAEVNRQRGVLDLDWIHDDVASPAHPLHDRYEWDDSKAGREYRKQQIARDIRSVQFVYISDDGRAERARQYLSNREVGRPIPGYITTQEALSDPTTLEYMHKALEIEISTMRRRYQHLQGYVPVLERELTKARERQMSS